MINTISRLYFLAPTTIVLAILLVITRIVPSANLIATLITLPIIACIIVYVFGRSSCPSLQVRPTALAAFTALFALLWGLGNFRYSEFLKAGISAYSYSYSMLIVFAFICGFIFEVVNSSTRSLSVGNNSLAFGFILYPILSCGIFFFLLCKSYLGLNLLLNAEGAKAFSYQTLFDSWLLAQGIYLSIYSSFCVKLTGTRLTLRVKSLSLLSLACMLSSSILLLSTRGVIGAMLFMLYLCYKTRCHAILRTIFSIKWITMITLAPFLSYLLSNIIASMIINPQKNIFFKVVYSLLARINIFTSTGSLINYDPSLQAVHDNVYIHSLWSFPSEFSYLGLASLVLILFSYISLSRKFWNDSFLVFIAYAFLTSVFVAHWSWYFTFFLIGMSLKPTDSNRPLMQY